MLAWRKDPILFATEALRATPEDWQRAALAALATNDRLAIRSGHGVGKSTFLAWAILWFLCTRMPAKVACTAPTQHQLEDVLWSALREWLAKLPDQLRDEFDLNTERLKLKSDKIESFAVARTARQERPEAFQGLHSENMLLIADEASGVPNAIYEAGLGAMSTPGAKMILTGNPTQPAGYFYDVFSKPGLRDRWWRLRVSSEDVPRARHHIDDVIAIYGRDSNAYRVRVLGEFPTAADEQVIPLEWIEAAAKRTVQATELYRVVWGVDVARFGDDRSALCKRRGNVVLEPVRSWRGMDTMQTARLLKDAYETTFEDERPSEILVDVIGIGAGVVDRLSEYGLPVRGVNVGEAPGTADKFMRLRDELWWKAREWFGKRDCKIPDDPALVAELTAPTYSFSLSNKTVIESKDDQKKRLGSSPDLADAFVLTMAGGLDRVDEHQQDRYARKTRRYGGASWMST